MKNITLLSLALTVALSVDAHCVPKNANKKEACSSLSEGGLLNLNALGCSETDISPTLNILSSRASAKFRERAWKHDREEKKSNTEICQSFSKAGLINLSALGCSENTIDPTINILSTRGLKHYSPERQKEICESFSKADFINLDILGCSKTDISPDINILSDLHHREVEGLGLEKRTNGCYCPPPKKPEHHHHHHSSTTTTKKWTSTPTPTHKSHEHDHKTSPSCPTPSEPAPKPTGKPHHDDGKCSGESQEEYCSSLSKAGLINLNILGCSKNKIDPTVNILSNIGL